MPNHSHDDAPRSREDLLASGDAHNSPSYRPAHVIMDHGQGVYLYDRSGREYLDFVAGIAVNCLGYNHPRLVAALRRQARRLLHVSNMYYTAEQIELMEALCERSIGDRVFLCNSGAEAVEAGLKLMRRYQKRVAGQPERYQIISLEKSFHGRTMGAITATGQPKYHDGFEPMVPGFAYAAFDDLDSVRELVGPQTAGIIVEPVQGEGGVRPCSQEYLRGLRELCDEHGLVLMFDEVQAGVGRTGHLFAYESFGVEPDIVSLAKGLGGGFPVGAMLARGEVFEGWTRGSHASTFGGNPMASVAALTVLETIEADGLLEHVRRVGRYLVEGLEELAAGYDVVEQVRGRGLMVGVVCGEASSEIARLCREEGLLINTAGGVALRLVPPLIVEEPDCDEALRRLERALDRHAHGAPGA
jgi:predicted acetylornithine/succinylornithine family transaminase